MTVTLSLPPEIERALKANATRRGMSLENYALEVLKREAPVIEDSKAFYSMSPEERAKEFLKWAESHDHITAVADDSRESIYKGCGE